MGSWDSMASRNNSHNLDSRITVSREPHTNGTLPRANGSSPPSQGPREMGIGKEGEKQRHKEIYMDIERENNRHRERII